MKTADKNTPRVKAKDVAAHYGVTPETVYLWAKAGKIPSIRFEGTTRFDLAAVIEAIEGKKP